MLIVIIAFLGAFCMLFYIKYIDEKNKYLYKLGEIKVYKSKDRIITPNEMKLFTVLKQMSSLNDFDIFPQIPYSSIIEVNPEKRDLGGRFDYINDLRTDFLLADKHSSKPVLVIELNNETHEWKNRKARDYFVYSALDNARIKYIVLKTKDLIDLIKLESIIQEKLTS